MMKTFEGFRNTLLTILLVACLALGLGTMFGCASDSGSTGSSGSEECVEGEPGYVDCKEREVQEQLR
jgi:hypothetical protein